VAAPPTANFLLAVRSGFTNAVTHWHEPDPDARCVKLCDPHTSLIVSKGLSVAVGVPFRNRAACVFIERRGAIRAQRRASLRASLGATMRHSTSWATMDRHLIRILHIDTFEYVDFTT